MGVIIKGMELPPYCYDCPFYDAYRCVLIGYILDDGIRDRLCPMEEVEDEHTD